MELDFHKNSTILREMVDTMSIGVFTLDRKGRVAAWSTGAETLTGYRSSDVVGQSCSILQGDQCKGFSIIQLALETTSDKETTCHQECRIRTKNGQELYVQLNVRPLYDDGHERVGAIGTFIDVTSLVLANETIASLEKQVNQRDKFEQLIGTSHGMHEVFRQLKLAADSDVTVLVTGESGTGKELAAKAIHLQSERRDQPYFALNCSAIPDTLLESELFGHTKGSFTGASNDKAGVFEAAHGGTLFLDEIGDVSPAIQVKLLRVLQEREIRRIGENTTRKVDVRLITATNRDLMKLVESGDIREDFYYRIHVFEIRIPSLRERKEDIPTLVDHFLKDLCKGKDHPITGIARDALQLLMDYDWPGNVRQLRNAIEHACVTVSGDRISYLDLPPELRDPHGLNLPDIQDDLSPEELEERNQILFALKQTKGNRTKAATLLGYSRVTLWKKIGKYAIEIPS